MNVPANGTALISYANGTESQIHDNNVYRTGVTAFVTSATTCFTKTTGVITGFFRGFSK